MTRTPFLTAEWRYLAMLNWAIDPSLLERLAPAGTGLDFFEGRTFVSLVGFLFRNTRVRGVAVPFHRHFEEVNLRFYVRYGERRGVAFIREIVPRAAIAAVARWVFDEPYVALPMAHSIDLAGAPRVEYRWRQRGEWSGLTLHACGSAAPAAEGSLAQFITEHYWGYTAQPAGCSEYEVEHPPWRLWPASKARFAGEVRELYGEAFAKVLSRDPDSAFLAEGSPVTVYSGCRVYPKAP